MLTAMFWLTMLLAPEETGLEGEVKKLKEQLESLEKRVTDAEAKSFDVEKLLQDLVIDKKDAEKEAETLYDEAFWFIGHDDKLKLSVWAQEDFRAFDSGYPGDNTFLNRRVRIAGAGSLEGIFNYQVMLAAERSTSPVQFAWVEFAPAAWARLRVGQFKEPYAMQELLPDLYMEGLERSVFVIDFAPAQDIGAMFHGKAPGDWLEYGVGVFNGRGKNNPDTSDDKDFAGRVTIQPIPQIRFGGSATYGRQDESFTGLSLATAGATKFFNWSSGVGMDNRRSRVAAEIELMWGPAVLRGEWLRTDFYELELGLEKESAAFEGWYVEAAVVVTGESKKRGRPVAPDHELDHHLNGWGAVEIFARYEAFRGDGELIDRGFASGTDDLKGACIGVNWWLNRHVRFGAAWFRTMFDDSILLEGRTYRNEDLFLFRLQFEI